MSLLEPLVRECGIGRSIGIIDAAAVSTAVVPLCVCTHNRGDQDCDQVNCFA